MLAANMTLRNATTPKFFREFCDATLITIGLRVLFEIAQCSSITVDFNRMSEFNSKSPIGLKDVLTVIAVLLDVWVWLYINPHLIFFNRSLHVKKRNVI